MNAWIAVDLDGTLAHYDEWRGIGHIGRPILPMIRRVKRWIKEGKNVKIFTARIYDGNTEAERHIQAWSLENIGEILPVTNIKDFGMLELWDDRAIQVEKNTGMRMDKKPEGNLEP